jgi:hypothetical protein
MPDSASIDNRRVNLETISVSTAALAVDTTRHSLAERPGLDHSVSDREYSAPF